MSNLIAHAERELGNQGIAGDDGYDGMLVDAVMAHIRLFADQGHSGFSAGLTVSLLEKLLRYEPLGPLTGADDEWVALDYDDDMQAQNNRCGRVFRRKDGTAYDIEGRVFMDPDGTMCTGAGSRVEVTFPYTPTTVIQHRDADGNWVDEPVPPPVVESPLCTCSHTVRAHFYVELDGASAECLLMACECGRYVPQAQAQVVESDEIRSGWGQ